MKTISKLLDELKETPKAEQVIVDSIFLEEAIPEDLCSEYGLLLEKKDSDKPVPGTHYVYRIDPSRGTPGPGNLRHVHIYNKGKQIFAMNIDGTAHDGCHKVKIHKDLVDFLKKKGFTIPADNLIEMVNPVIGTRQLLCD